MRAIDLDGAATSTQPTSVPHVQRRADPRRVVIQRYTTKKSGLSVAGELHTKSPEDRKVEKDFAHHIKGVPDGELCYWEESSTPGTGDALQRPQPSESDDHFIAWDIDRMSHHYRLIEDVLDSTTPPGVGPTVLDNVSAAQVALSAASMLETLTFASGDLGSADAAYKKAAEACSDMSKEYKGIFADLKAAAIRGSLDSGLRERFTKAKFPEAMKAMDSEISRLLPGLSETRKISYDFTRTTAMNDLANQKKSVKGVWVVGEYHVQEIEEHLSHGVAYDLVSMNDFNADVKAYDESTGGSTIKVDYLGELLTLSRKLSMNLDYFVKETDKRETMEARLAHWGRCMGALSALDDLVRQGLDKAVVPQASLPNGVKLEHVKDLVATIREGLDKERNSTLAFDPESGEGVPEDLYALVRDAGIQRAAKDLNVLSGLAEFLP